jgi:hypothetical protein
MPAPKGSRFYLNESDERDRNTLALAFLALVIAKTRHEDFSVLLPYRDYVTIGRYRYLFKRLTAVSAGRFYRFEHIVAYSSGKVVAK